MMRKETIFRLTYFFISHIILIILYLAVTHTQSLLSSLSSTLHYLLVYKFYYLNDDLFYFLNHPLPKKPASIVIASSKDLSQSQTQKLLNYSAHIGIGQVTFYSSAKYNLIQPSYIKPINYSFQPRNSVLPELLSLIKSNKPFDKTDLISPSANLLIYYGRKGMILNGIPIRHIYSSEIYWLRDINPISFFKVIERFSNSEQRNGRQFKYLNS